MFEHQNSQRQAILMNKKPVQKLHLWHLWPMEKSQHHRNPSVPKNVLLPLFESKDLHRKTKLRE